MVGRMKSNRPGQCPVCGSPWYEGSAIAYNEGRQGFYCSDECAILALERVPVRVDAQTPQTVTYTTPRANIAVNEATERSRAIHEAHMENMAANERLVQAIDLQTAVCDDLRAELAKIALELKDARMEGHGIQLPGVKT